MRLLAAWVLVVAATLAAGPAWAANRTWNDVGGGNLWSTNGNWNGVAAPTLADDVFLGNGFNNTTISLDVTGSSNSLTITTGVSFTITPTAGQNLIINSGSLTRLSTASGTQTIGAGIVLNANGSWAIDGAGRLVVNGVIDDGASTFNLTKSGTGLLVLGGANTFGGTTSITSGTILLTNAAALQNSTFTTGTAAGGTLSFGGLTTATFGALVGTNNLALSNTSAAAVALTVGGNNASTTYSGTLSGGGSLTKAGTGNLTLAGQNTYTGLTTISGGTLAYGTSNALSTGGVTVNGGVLNIASFSGTVGTVTLTNGSIIGAGTLTSGTNFLTNSGTISAILSGTGANVGIVQGTGTTVLTAANTFTGTSSIASGGALNLQNANALGTSGSSVTVASGGALQLQGGFSYAATKPLSLAGTGVATDGALRNISGTNTWQSGITLAAATQINSDADLLTLSGTIGGSFPLLFGGAGNITVSNTIATGTGTLTKSGAGTLTLSASNTYTGLTTISGGTLAYGTSNALATGDVTVNGGVLDIAGFSDSVGLVTLTSGTIQGTTGVLSGTSYSVASGLVSAILSGTNLTKTTAGTVTLTGANTYTGTTGITAGVLNIQNSLALGGTSAGSTVTSGAALQLQGGIAVGAEALSLSGSGIANDGALRNILGNNSYAGVITLGTNSRINSDANLLTLSGNVTAANLGLTVGGNGNTTIGGTVGLGSGSLTKDGAGTLTLSAQNTYTGTTAILSGTLSASSIVVSSSASNLGNATSAVTLGDAANEGTLSYEGNSASFTRGFALGAGGGQLLVNTAGQTLTISGSNVASTSGTFTVGGAGNTTVSATLAMGTGGLTKEGAGTLTLNSANTYTGLTTISGGTLAYGIASALSTGGVTVNAGGVLNVGSFNDTVGAITLNGGSIIGTTGTLTSTANIATNNGTISAAISGTGPNVGIVQGTGTTFLTTANTITGTSSIASGGALNLQNANALGTSGSSVTVVSGGALQLQGTGSTAFASKPLSLNGTGVSSDGALRNISGTNTWQGGVTLAGATQINSDAGLLTLSGTIGAANQNLTFGGAGNTTVSNTISIGTGGINMVGSGTLTLSGTGTASGNSSFSGGTVVIGNNNLFTAGTTGTMTFTNGATLVAGTGAGSFTIARPISLGSGGGTLVVDQLNTLQLTGSITGGGGLVKSGANDVILGSSGTNNIGPITINGGRLFVGQLGNIASSTIAVNTGYLAFSTGSTGTFAPSNTITVASGAGITNRSSGTGTLTISSTTVTLPSAGSMIFNFDGGAQTHPIFFNGTYPTLTGSLAIQVGAPGLTAAQTGTVTINAPIAGSFPWSKEEAGTLVLGGSNSFSGGVAVNAGVLQLGNANALNPSGTNAVSVASGGVLRLNGNSPTIAGLTGSGTVDNGAAGAAVLTIGLASGTSQFGGTLANGASGTTSLVKSGNGTQILTAANTYTGSTSITAGALNVQNSSALGTTGTVTVAANAALELQGGVNVGRVLNLAGSGVSSGGALRSVSGSNTYSGTISLGVGVAVGVDAGSLTLTGGVGSGAGSSFTKNGSGLLVLNAGDTSTGVHAVNSGTFQFGASGSTVPVAWVIGDGATLDLNGKSIVLGATGNASGTMTGASITTGTGTLILGGTLGVPQVTLTTNASANSSTISGNLSLGGTSTTFNVADGAAADDLIISANISNGVLLKSGAGLLKLSGSNSYAGRTAVQDGTLAITSVAALGTSGTINLGVGATSSGFLQYLGGSGTLAQNINSRGIGTDTIQNAGSGTLVLSGTVDKNGTVLRLRGGSQGITVTGQITGVNPSSDLVVSQGLTTLSTTNSYNGPTFIQDSGTLALGISNAIPSNSIVTLGNSAGAGRLTTGTFTNAIGGLLFSGSGGTVAIAANQTGSPQITTTGTINLAGSSTLDLTGMQTSASVYKLISGGTFLGTFGTVTGLDSNYILRYGTLTANELDAQRRANQATTFTMTTGSVTRALVNTNVAVSGTITNSTQAGGSNLAVSLSSGGTLTVGNFGSGTSSIAPLASTTVTGSIQTGNTAGTQGWSVINTDNSAIQTTSTASGSLQVVNQRVFTPSASTIALGNLHAGTVIGGTTVSITSTGSNATTASGTLGSFTGGPSGYAFGLTSGSAQFVGSSLSQTATYTFSGTATTPGSVSGTYTSVVAGEFSGIPNIAIAVTGNVYSGQSTWATNGGGNWGTLTGTGANAFGVNWGTNQGSPGLDSAYTTTDTATFGSVLTGGTAQVYLSGASPSLKSLTFDNSAGSYELYPSNGSGPITMIASGTSASINVLSGTHANHSDIVLGASTVVNVAAGGAFTFHSDISGSSAYSLTKSGGGTMNIVGNNGYAGNTFITGGSVVILSGTAGLGSGTVSLTNGSVLNLNFLPLGNVINVTSGTVLNAANSQSTIDVTGTAVFEQGPFTKGLINVLPGGVATFNNALGETGTNSATLTVNSAAQGFINAGIGEAGNVGVNAGGTATIAGTNLGSITATGSGGSLAVVNFNGVHDGDLDIFSGGVVNFAGSNLPLSTFNVGAGGLASVTGTIAGELHVSGTANISGSVISGADMIVEAGGRVTLQNTASFAQTPLTNNGRLIVDRTTNALSLGTQITGTGLLQKTGTGSLTLTGSSSFTGGTQLDAGTLFVNGSLASGVATAAGATLGGSGSIGGALTGAGLVAPGASPGILTATQFDPTGGLAAAFEITALTPNYAVSGTGALNDVLRLTDSSPFGGNSLTSANAIDFYFSAGTITPWQRFDAGFFTTLSGTNLVAAVQGGNFNYWAPDPSGPRVYNGQHYSLLTTVYPQITSVILTARDLLNTNFGSGGVVPTGSVTQIVVVPEPGTLVLGAVGAVVAFGWSLSRRRRGRRPAGAA